MALTTADLNDILSNPYLVQSKLAEEMSTVNGETVFFESPSHPIISSMEANVLTSCSFAEQLGVTLAKTYPSMAESWDDLFRHMSDTDYLNIYALPSELNGNGAYVLLSLEEIILKAVAIPESEIRKLTIPRHTQLMLGELAFTLEYPIDIRVNNSGGLEILYDTAIDTDVGDVKSNKVKWKTISISNQPVVLLYLNVKQYRVNVHHIEVGASAKLSTEIGLTDQYYYCEALMQTDSGWTRIKTTHSDSIYDSSDVTVLLKVEDNRLKAKVPRIYQNNGTLKGRIRLRVYTTQGPIVRNLSGFTAESTSIRFGGEDRAATIYDAPLDSLEYVGTYSTEVTENGRNAMSFAEVRELVIDHKVDDGAAPIRRDKLYTSMINKGYSITNSIDNVTGRTFLATRSLPAPIDLRFETPINGMLSTFAFTMDDLRVHPSAYDNSNRVTLSPDATFEWSSNGIELLHPDELSEYTSDMNDNVLLQLNDRKLLFTPFHYIFDTNDNLFRMRMYQLSTPAVTNRFFLGTNDRLGLGISISTIEMLSEPDGYSLLVATESDEAIQHLTGDQTVIAQLSYIPNRTTDRAFLNGEYIGDVNGQRVFKFKMECSYDVDADDYIQLSNFYLFDRELRDLQTGLTHDFVLSFAVVGYSVQRDVSSDLDTYLATEYLDTSLSIYTISAEQLTIKLGSRITNFWDASRSYVGETDYQRYTEAKIKTHDNNVYEEVGDTGQIFTYTEENGLVYNLTHVKGDPVVINGETQYEYQAGEIVYDTGGEPIIIGPGKIERQAEMYFLDGRLKYVTDVNVLQYVSSIPAKLAQWAEMDLKDIADNLIGRSALKFYPRTTLGDVPVLMDSGVLGSIDSEQTLTVQYYMTSSGYNDTNLRSFLESVTREIVNDMIKSTVISTDAIVDRLRDRIGSDVQGITVSGLGGERDLDVISIQDSDKHLSIKKRLTRLSDSTITMADAISIEYLRHSASSV